MALDFTIVEVTTTADLEAGIELSKAAWAKSPLAQATYAPHLAHLTSPEDLKAWRLKQAKESFENEHVKTFKAVVYDEDTGTETSAGFAIWHTPDYDWGKDIWEAKSKPEANSESGSATAAGEDSAPQSKEDSIPACIDAKIFLAQRTAMREMRRQVWGNESEKYWYLAALAVHPDFHRRGIGAELLQWGFSASEQDGIPIYLEATPVGRPLYSRNGFDEVAYAKFLNDTYTITGMKRIPAARTRVDA